MRLNGVVLLAAQTARSQAYLQALVANDLYPERVICVGEKAPPNVPRTTRLERWHGILLPNLSESLLETAGRADVPTVSCASDNINSEEVQECIGAAGAEVLIYSGLGGQIVSERTLGLGPKFLHMHSGWLPEYRGSTTLYYALLAGDQPGVTALILDRNIDTGPLVARKRYPRPPAGMDLDYVFDTAIRADMLVEVMRDYAVTGKLKVLEHQQRNEGRTHYVIHPVLKHLAILSLSNNNEIRLR